MRTVRNTGKMVFQPHGRRKVEDVFDGGRVSSDGGALLLREADLAFGVTERLAECFTDFRNPFRSEHGVRNLIAQRVMAVGRDRRRERDRGHPLATPSTPDRLEFGVPGEAERHLYKLWCEHW